MPYGQRVSIDQASLEAIAKGVESGQPIKPEVFQRIDFDEIHRNIVVEAALQLDLNCVRCDEIAGAGSIHKDMFNQILDADVAIVDLSTLNPNVLYELGVRHALRNKTTVLIQRKGTRPPFNIHGYRCITYDETEPSDAVKEIVRFVHASRHGGHDDSPVYDYIDDLRQPQRPISVIKTTMFHDFEYSSNNQISVGLVTGELRNIHEIDVWVNSENRNMQMARFFDRSISGTIRWLGAVKSDKGTVVKDTIAEELAVVMGADREVEGGIVLSTGPGQLRQTNGVKRIFHAATAQGVRPYGYAPIPESWSCVGKALELIDKLSSRDEPLQSILFPLIGTGTGGGDIEEAFQHMLEETLAYLSNNSLTTVRRVYFLAPFADALRLGFGVLRRSPSIKEMVK